MSPRLIIPPFFFITSWWYRFVPSLLAARVSPGLVFSLLSYSFSALSVSLSSFLQRCDTACLHFPLLGLSLCLWYPSPLTPNSPTLLTYSFFLGLLSFPLHPRLPSQHSSFSFIHTSPSLFLKTHSFTLSPAVFSLPLLPSRHSLDALNLFSFSVIFRLSPFLSLTIPSSP